MLDILLPLSLMVHKRDLLKEFVIREIKGRLAGTTGGILWTIISPLSIILSYYFVFSLVLRVPVTVKDTGTGNFLFFFLTGFFPWIMFADSLSKSVLVLLNNASLITKVVFPVELLPMSAVIATFIVNGIGFLLVLILLAFNGFVYWSWAYIPLLTIILAFFTLGLSFFLSALDVFIRDTSEVLIIVIMLWFFGTPVIYPYSLVPAQFLILITLNPMALFVKIFREAILIHNVDLMSVLVLSVLSLLSYGIGFWFFKKAKPAFGDVL